MLFWHKIQLYIYKHCGSQDRLFMLPTCLSNSFCYNCKVTISSTKNTIKLTIERPRSRIRLVSVQWSILLNPFHRNSIICTDTRLYHWNQFFPNRGVLYKNPTNFWILKISLKKISSNIKMTWSTKYRLNTLNSATKNHPEWLRCLILKYSWTQRLTF